MEYRDTTIKRSAIDASVRERVWGRSAARCVLCSTWLINEESFWHAIPVGQIAHNVGATSGANSPRGDSALTSIERAEESNLFLLCADCHRLIDSAALRGKYTVAFLCAKKLEHERRVREVTAFPTLRPATVIRLTAQVRGTYSPATDAQVSEALRLAGLTGMGADTRTGSFDISLPHDENDEWVWSASMQGVDAGVARALDAVAAQDVGVMAVFALGPIPTLVYLGAALDDKAEAVLFPRRRIDGSAVWSWPEQTGMTAEFESHLPESDGESANDVVVLVEVSAPVEQSRIPTHLGNAPIVRLRVRGALGTDAIASPQDLESFATAWRSLLAEVEQRWPTARRLHIFAAVPNTVAIAIGRHRMRGAHPAFVVYQRQTESYVAALEVAE